MAKKRQPADLTKRNEEAVKKMIRRIDQRITLLEGSVNKLAAVVELLKGSVSDPVDAV